MKKNIRFVKTASLVMAVSLLLAAAPIGPRDGGFASPLGGVALASSEKPVKTYTFEEVGAIAQQNSSDIIRQKVAVDQAENSKESSLDNLSAQSYNFYADPESGIKEEMLYSLQDSYESAVTSWEDAEETLKKLKPKVAYQAQKLYLDILQTELQITIQEKEIVRLKDEYELAKAKAAFGAFTQTQLRNAKNQWESAVDTLESLQSSLKTSKNSMREYLNLADDVDFALADPPVFGEYTKEFDDKEVLSDALRNSMSLKQAKREVDELAKKVHNLEIQGDYDQARRLQVTSTTRDLSLKETQQTLTRTVENLMQDFHGLDEALEKAKDALYAAQRALISIRLKQNLGTSTINELRQAEKTVLAAEKDVLQAQYNCYLVAKKVALMKDGVLVN